MPIIDLTIVVNNAHPVPPDEAQRLADALGSALAMAPGRLWLRLHALPASHYAENDSQLSASELPAFLTVLHARRPEGPALAEEAALLARVVAEVLGREASHIHIEYQASGAGRMAFGGRLVP